MTFDEYWGNKWEKWNGKLDIKNFAREIWEIAAVSDKREGNAIKHSIISELNGFTDYEGNQISQLNYLQVIRKLVEMRKELGELS